MRKAEFDLVREEVYVTAILLTCKLNKVLEVPAVPSGDIIASTVHANYTFTPPVRLNEFGTIYDKIKGQKNLGFKAIEGTIETMLIEVKAPYRPGDKIENTAKEWTFPLYPGIRDLKGYVLESIEDSCDTPSGRQIMDLLRLDAKGQKKP